MNWLNSLFFGTGVPHSIFILTIAIAVGIYLSHRLKFKGITLGITWILFCAIAMSHFGMHLDPVVETFAKDFGLILFVYSIGLQVGPSFFSSFGKGGIKLNMLAISIVLLSCVVAYLIHLFSGEDIATMTGVLFGAVTNTPGLGAAQQAFTDITGEQNANIASGYAMAYPLGVVGIILSLLAMRWFFKIRLDKEEERLAAENEVQKEIEYIDLLLTNPQVEGANIRDLSQLCHFHLIVSRLVRPNGDDELPDVDTVLHVGDRIRVVVDKENEKSVLLLGMETSLPTDHKAQAHLVSRHVIVTKPELNGKRIGDLNVRATYHVSITRIRRAGIELLATRDLYLQLGDRMTVVGEERAVDKVEKLFGNSTKKLDIPNLASIFLGLALGVAAGMLPIALPGLAQPFKLGIAGGSLIVAILLSCFGPKMHIVTYTTSSANLMIREIGIAMFLAAVGFGAGKTFIPTLLDGGYAWIGYGVIITLVPLLLMGVVGRLWLKLDYFTLMGVLAGSTTNPPALAYATTVSSTNDRAAVAYSTVYPLTMFLRVLTGQLMILLFV
ncbi:MAG: putative transporter [Paludibacteraceae bacterium]|nr:putative transporter [Paludibacteraceae bacterium]